MNQIKTANSIIFIGKFDEPMLSLELKTLKINPNFNQPLGESISMPDVVKYQIEGYECDVWLFLGDVKPTLLLKNLISETEIILFVINIENEESLAFLDQGWGPIIEKAEKASNFKLANQQRFLIGTKSGVKPKSDQINEQITRIKEKFHCSAYFEEVNSQDYKLKINDKNSIIQSDLIEHLKSTIKKKQKTEANASRFNAQNREKVQNDKNTQNEGISLLDQNNKFKDIKQTNAQHKRQIMQIENSNQKKDDGIQLKGSIKQNENLKQQKENDDNDNDEFVELEDIRSKKLKPFIDSNEIVYDLFDKSLTANVIGLSAKHKSNVTIPQFINCYSKQFIVTRICDKSFLSSPKIKSLSFVKNSRVQSIGNNAFCNSSLEYLFIPSSLKKIFDYTFYGANSIKEIEVDSSNNCFSTRDGLLIFNDKPNEKNALGEVIFAIKDFGGSFKCKENVTQYKFNRNKNSMTFTSNKLSQLILSGESFKYFNKCQNILDVSILSSRLVEILFGFFEDSYIETVRIECPEVHIGELSFKHCKNLKLVDLKISKITTIYDRSFAECELLTKIDIESQSKINLFNRCFVGNGSLQSFKAKSNEINIGDNCFTNCSSLSSISILNTKSMKIGQKAFMGCQSLEILKIRISSSIEIGNYCFSQSNKLKLIEIAGITKLNISEGCFENCESLTTISLPDCLEVNFLNYSLSGCNKLTKIILNPESSASFSDLCFGETKIKSPLEILCSEITINNLTSNPIRILNKVKSINIITDKIIDKFEFIDKLSTLEFLSITIECEQEFAFNSKLIEKFTSLNTFNLNIKSGLIVKSESFSKLNKLESIDITSETLIIENNNLNKKRNLREITMRSHYIQIHTNCFNELMKLENVIFQSEKIDIGESCFKNCQQISTVFLKNSNYVKIGTGTFSECPNLNEFIINSNKTSASEYFTIIFNNKSKETSFAKEKSSDNNFHYKSLAKQIKNENELSEFFKKILQIKSTTNPSVLPIYCLTFQNFKSESYPTIFTEYIKGKSLEAALNEGKLTNTQRYMILIGITNGMKYLHSKGIFHSNLTPSNIILDKNLYPYINDYMNLSKNRYVTKYTAPEILNNNFYSFENDIYSFSIIAYELLTGVRLFKQYSPSQIINFIIQKGERPDLNSIKNEQIKTFFERCWSQNEKLRPAFDNIYDEVITSVFLDEFEAEITETNVYLKLYGIEIKQKQTKISEMKNKATNIVSPQSVDPKVKTPSIISVSSSGANSSFSDTKKILKQNKLIIRRYLKSKLFITGNNLYIYNINDKTKIGDNLQSLTSKISPTEDPDFLYYTIHYGINYIVEYFDIRKKVQDLPKYLNMQMKPKKTNDKDIRVCIFCNEEKLQRKKLDENLFSIVIEFTQNDSVESIKNKIIHYLNSKTRTYINPKIYVFYNNEFKLLKSIQHSKNRTDPLFVSWENYTYEQLKEYISRNTTKLAKI